MEDFVFDEMQDGNCNLYVDKKYIGMFSTVKMAKEYVNKNFNKEDE